MSGSRLFWPFAGHSPQRVKKEGVYMKVFLEQARDGGQEALKDAAEFVKMLPRDEDGVFVAFQPEMDVYEAGRLVYPVYMKYETQYGKKAGYADIAAQLSCLGKRLEKTYGTKQAADFLTLLTDTLSEMSPEIYEHYRSIQDLLKEQAKLFVSREKLFMRQFPKEELRDSTEKEKLPDLRRAGEALVSACEKELLSTEKYEALGRCLQEAG